MDDVVAVDVIAVVVKQGLEVVVLETFDPSQDCQGKGSLTVDPVKPRSVLGLESFLD